MARTAGEDGDYYIMGAAGDRMVNSKASPCQLPGGAITHFMQLAHGFLRQGNNTDLS
jgi:hypothetical protein